jgi:hypothetical protein
VNLFETSASHSLKQLTAGIFVDNKSNQKKERKDRFFKERKQENLFEIIMLNYNK